MRRRRSGCRYLEQITGGKNPPHNKGPSDRCLKRPDSRGLVWGPPSLLQALRVSVVQGGRPKPVESTTAIPGESRINGHFGAPIPAHLIWVALGTFLLTWGIIAIRTRTGSKPKPPPSYAPGQRSQFHPLNRVAHNQGLEQQG